ncbi:glycosyltransferase [Microbulbifer sp. 2304DJ12-6]|uniref:glycosyltransferase n=1 Tax=Microbulbifer sp. 2304DJ12-6 TaxID=3233340 RepID=UPI0039AEE033
MKVLVLGPISSPIIRRLQSSLTNEGFNVVVASHNAKHVESAIDLGELKSFWGYLNFIKIRKLIKKYKPDIVHAHGLNHYGLLCLFQSRPLVVALWGSDVLLAPTSGNIFKKYVFKFINKLVLRKSTRLHTSALYVAEEANKQCPGALEKTDIFYWGFPLNRPNDLALAEVGRKLEEEFSLCGNGYIVFPRGLAGVYNPEAAAKIINTMLAENIKNQIVVLQGFAASNDVDRFLQCVDVSKIRLIDRLLDEGELYYIYEKSDVHFSIPLSDSLGGGVVEPSLLGSFPVLSDLPSYKDYLSQNKGYMLLDYDKSTLFELAHKIKSGEIGKSSLNVPTLKYGLRSVLSKLKLTYALAASEKH